MQELWQLYDSQGQAINGRGANKDDIYSNGLLHGASHVWIWRINKNSDIEILLQKRSARKRTWPNLYDISAAGHIDRGESPLEAALRETREEIGIQINENELNLISVHRAELVAGSSIENEFQWIYLFELDWPGVFNIEDGEVDSIEWKNLTNFKSETIQTSSELYVPHGRLYYETVIEFIEKDSIKN